MDWLDRVSDYIEQQNRFTYRDDEAKRIEPKTAAHNITIIGVIRGIDGWYRCGYDEQTKTIVPIELIEKVLIPESAQKMQKFELKESEVSE